MVAKGITHIHFDANMWVYLILVIGIGISWGIGKAAVYKHIPEYFPTEVGVVGGMVGMIGGLGGFFGPIIFQLFIDCNRYLVKLLDIYPAIFCNLFDLDALYSNENHERKTTYVIQRNGT